MSKHTKEPWEIDEHENYFFIMRRWGGGVEPGKSSVFGSADGALIGSLEFVGDTAVPTRKQAEANARRIVACVNACAGMADPEKEIAALRAAAEKAREALKRISVYGTHRTMACKTLDGGLVPSEEKKNFYALVADSALAALEEVLK